MTKRRAPEIVDGVSGGASRFRSDRGRDAVRAWEQLALERMGCEVHARSVPTRFGVTHVLEAGPRDAPPLILLHGIGLSAASFWLQIPELSKTHRVFAPDVIGGAGRSAPVVPKANNGYAFWLLDLLDGLELSQAAFVGHSLGGWMTLELAILPEGARRISSAVLMASSGITRVAPKALWTLGAAILRGGRVGSERLVGALTAPGRPLDPFLVNMFEVVLTGVKPPFVMPWTYSRRQLEALVAPVVVLAGAHEILFAEGLEETAKANIPSLLRVEVLDGVGHGLIWEEPERVNALISASLRTRPV